MDLEDATEVVLKTWRSAVLRAGLRRVEGMVPFVSRHYSSARKRAFGNVTGLFSFVPRCGTGAWCHQQCLRLLGSVSSRVQRCADFVWYSPPTNQASPPRGIRSVVLFRAVLSGKFGLRSLFITQ